MSVIPNPENKTCPVCRQRPARIWMRSYSGRDDIILCDFDALQLARKILEDLCEMAGDRHG